jgi:hypothetical protein
MTNKNIFYIFGILQAITLGLIIFFILQTTNIGRDTNIERFALWIELNSPRASHI